MKEKFLPVGSIVLLKGATKRVMVAGYLAIDNQNRDIVYDYSGCMYPEGFLGSDQTLLFNHDQIDKIYFDGFQDEEQDSFLKKLKDISEELKKEISSIEKKEVIIPEDIKKQAIDTLLEEE